MGFSKVVPLLLLAAKSALANTPIPASDFSQNGGLAAAQAAAPMWYMASGTCMPSAAEDGQGHQTNGVDTDNCNINALANGCPQQPAWQGANTFYGNVPGEPWGTIPTYWKAAYCGNTTWRIIYYVYFKKDTGHKSDWEGIVVEFTSPDGGNTYVRNRVIMEQGMAYPRSPSDAFVCVRADCAIDGSHKPVDWDNLNDTFQGYVINYLKR
ncbi:hypothetical protein TgHK011_009495 [Trichoderma gracile]|nr:hypothetical protein TgHK011_009495 [Trichoderma gracile]